jgi:hypothetical protein
VVFWLIDERFEVDFWCGILVDWQGVLSWFSERFNGWLASDFKLIFDVVLGDDFGVVFKLFSAKFWGWFLCGILVDWRAVKVEFWWGILVDFWCGIEVDWRVVLSWFLVRNFGWLASGFKLVFGLIMELILVLYFVWLASSFKLIFGVVFRLIGERF